jgi:phospholipid/cholesterol/gamma-HCH transport system permease protein
MEIDANQRAVMETVAKFVMDPPQPDRAGWSEPLLSLGGRLLRMLDHLKALTRLVGQLLLDILRLVRHPQEGPWRDFSGHLYHIGATALPITALVGFLIGVVLAYLISQQLRQFGADAFIVNILGISLIRELGPVLAAILIAGRSGSAITAQIGVMRVTEELDAMRVMGIAKGFRLVMPRALALSIVMPLISVWTTLAALLGGMLAAQVAMGITPAFFMNALPEAVEVANLTLATCKSVVFGLLIALIGCHFGLRVKPNTESLGQGTTASVVTSITVVILVDALFAVLFKNVGI